MTFIVEGLVTRKIPIVSDGKVKEVEGEFFFGTLAFKLVRMELDVDLYQLDEKVELIKKDPINGIDFLIDFMYLTHKAWCMISDKDVVISKNQLWLAIDIMGAKDFTGILEEGMRKYNQDPDEKEDTKKKTKKPRPTPAS